MKQLTVKANDAGQRVDKFLTKAFPSLPQAMLYKGIRTKNIKLNRKRCQISDRLNEGDILEVYLPDDVLTPPEYRFDFLKASKSLEIAYEDENILIADKKPGVIVHPDEEYQSDTLIARIQRYLYEKKEYDPDAENSFAPSLVNRIDRNTGGLVIAAKTASALRILNQKMKDREIKKEYLCIVHGVPKKKEATLTGYLVKNESQNRVYIDEKKSDSAKTIKTKYKVLASKNDISLVEVDLLTGRTHQIRAHMASIGHPLLGDGKYGTNALNKGTGYTKQALYSYKMTFEFTTDAYELEYLNGKVIKAKNVPFIKEFPEYKI